MNGFIPDDKIEEIKKRADIVELVSEYVTLKKAGRNFLGICPFHSEKTPSFTVNREKQMYYCFGCGEGGHVFTFLMKMSNMTFPEAARHLAKKTGVVIPERTMTQKERSQYSAREKINSINEMATVYFVRNIASPAGQRARDYLKARGISDDVVREFRLGYAGDGWRTLKNFFDQKHIPSEIIIQAGLVVSKNETDGEGSCYDRFRERLIFPIEDESGRVIAFGGRVIGDGEPKYLNSPETPVFSKGKNLYGLNRGKESIRKNGYAILVEGYFDLIALWNVGITNVVATLGTALTKEQVELIRRYTGRIVVLFDPDEAGKKALERSLQLFLAGGLQTKVVVLPERYDPDDFVRKFGRKSLEEIISNAPSMVDYYIENIVGARATLEEKRDAVREALSFVSGLSDA
ncbi:MAG TPA: DNA primase, partial [Syntrophales bacterium]|nr:DNA primase [Syntrophales bacterium]